MRQPLAAYLVRSLIDERLASLDARLLAIVRTTMGSDAIVLLRYDVDKKTHASRPIFGAPAHLIEAMRAQLLTVETF